MNSRAFPSVQVVGGKRQEPVEPLRQIVQPVAPLQQGRGDRGLAMSDYGDALAARLTGQYAALKLPPVPVDEEDPAGRAAS